jgi:hypothetical protein
MVEWWRVAVQSASSPGFEEVCSGGFIDGWMVAVLFQSGEDFVFQHDSAPSESIFATRAESDEPIR